MKYQKGDEFLEITQDECDGFSPRDWDNLGTMYTWLRNYSIGDENPHDSYNDFLLKACEPYLSEAKYEELVNNFLDEKDVEYLNKVFAKHHVWLPIRAYIHSGITISTGSSYPYNDRWDSGTAGLIFASHETIKQQLQVKKVTKKVIEKVIAMLNNEVKVMDQALTGDVWCYRRYKIVKCDTCGHEEEENIDSCGGFYGSDFEENGLYDQAGVKITEWNEVD
ncbi:MAG: hypothetical protein WC307_06835 [Candidatus Nanoarchaeia archaeon]|jgi:hypothetical protein